MTAEPDDWWALLERWNGELLGDPQVRERLAPEVVASGWLGYDPASESALAGAEDRLGVALPPSYRAFLGVSNGWRDTGYFIEQVWPIDRVDWYASRHQDLIDAWIEGESYAGPPDPVPDEEYFVYGSRQQVHIFRSEYLADLLEVSDVGDGVYLLNPRVITADGEWEAWFLAHWLPGARRYRSFWDLMSAEYQGYLRLKGDQSIAGRSS